MITGIVKWLLENWRVVFITGLMVMCVNLANSAKVNKASALREKGRADEAQNLADTRQDTINDLQRRQKSVAALDAKYTKELADAKATIDQLQHDVATGKRRLQLNATCPDSATSASGVVNGPSARLTDSAQRDYFTLRERIEVAGNQIAGLQQYITEQCLK
ncbi:lysis protein [Erwinia pyri]|uniref:Lysis protein n=1 Tax=Erwinia pyri TaxID=3062598 RepID=A0AA50HNU2_9GAMM|nr:lysis protein [Erwinia sp. DE2]WLS77228.1 lysis protein [Erwinia sp. DE2]